jgi:hypothetical protein
MDKLKSYRSAAIGLLVLNLAILAFFFLHRPLIGGSNQRPRPTHLELEFDEAQQDAFFGLVGTHQAMMQRINQEQKGLLAEYFSSLAQNEPDSSSMVPQHYTKLEEEKISSTYDHFLNVKALLRPEQQQKFPSFVDRSLKHILGQGRNRPPSPKERQ